MLSVLKPWRFVAAIFLGFSLGFASGVYVYANYLDKPEVINQTEIKQKIKGHHNSGGALDAQFETEVDNSKTKKRKRRN